jgi:hypothetical protein
MNINTMTYVAPNLAVFMFMTTETFVTTDAP